MLLSTTYGTTYLNNSHIKRLHVGTVNSKRRSLQIASKIKQKQRKRNLFRCRLVTAVSI